MAASNIFKRFYRFSKFVRTMYILTVKYGLTNKQNLWNILRTDGNLRNNLPNMRLPRIFRFVIKKPVDPCENQWHHRSCRLEVFCRKGVVRNFAKFTGKHLHQILFLKKVAGVRPATLLKRDSDTGFSCEFCEISKNILLLQNTGACFWHQESCPV